MATIPENYNKIRAGIAKPLKNSPLVCRQERKCPNNGHLLGDRTKDRPGLSKLERRGPSMANCSSSDWPKTYSALPFQAGGNQAPLPVTSCTRKYTDSATFLYLAHGSGARIE